MRKKIHLKEVINLAERLENIEIHSEEELELELKIIIEKGFKISVKEMEKENSMYTMFYYFIDTQFKYFKNKMLIISALLKYLSSDKSSVEQKEHIINVLMEQSEDPLIEEKLFEIIEQKNPLLCQLIFDYMRVYPIASITKTSKFKEAIVEFMNSKDYENSFAKEKLFYRIPSQYLCAFDYRYFDETLSEQMPKKKLYKTILEDRLNSIRLITKNSIKSDIVKYYCKYILGKSYQNKFKEIVKSEKLIASN